MSTNWNPRIHEHIDCRQNFYILQLLHKKDYLSLSGYNIYTFLFKYKDFFSPNMGIFIMFETIIKS